MAKNDAVFSMRMPVPEAEAGKVLERGFLDLAAQGGDQVKAEVIKKPKEWIFRAEFTSRELCEQFASCLPGGKDAIQRADQQLTDDKELVRHLEKDIVLGVVIVMFDFEKKHTVKYVAQPSPEQRGREPVCYGENSAAIFYFSVYADKNHLGVKFTRYLRGGLHKDCSDSFGMELQKKAARVVDDYMLNGGGIPVDLKAAKAGK